MSELTHAQASRRLQQAHAAFHAAVEGLTEEQMGYIFEGSEGWTSVGDILKHLATGERGMLTVALRCASGQEPPTYEGFDLDRYNARNVEKLKALSPAEALALYETARQETLAALDGLTQDQLARPANHPVFGPVSVGGLFRVMAIHEEMHCRDIEKMIT